MTLSEKIVRELRRKKDMGMTSEMLASALHINTCKVATAAEALMEQEHLILGGDRCWYLGDAEAAGAAYVPAPEPALAPFIASGLDTLRALIDPLLPPLAAEALIAEHVIDFGQHKTAPAPPSMEKVPDLTEETVREVLEQITPEMTMDPFGFQVKPPLAQKKKSVEAKANQSNQFGEFPAWIRLKTWVETRPHHAMPISWTELSKELGIIKTTLGKARVSLLHRGEAELVAKLDRLVYRQDSKSIINRAGLAKEEQKPLTWPDGPIFDDLETLWSGLKKPSIPPLPGPLADYLEMLDGFDLICESQSLEPECVLRRRIAELKAWLQEIPQ